MLGADRTLDATQRIALDQLAQSTMSEQQFFAEVRETLADRRGLCGHVVAASGEHDVCCLFHATRQTRECRQDAITYQTHCRQHLELFDVLGKISRRHALVDVLVAG